MPPGQEEYKERERRAWNRTLSKSRRPRGKGVNTEDWKPKGTCLGGWRKACKILAYAFIRNDTQGPPDDVLMVFRANERLGGTSWLGAGAGENNGHTLGVACSHGLCAGVGGHGSPHRNSAEMRRHIPSILAGSAAKVDRPQLGGSNAIFGVGSETEIKWQCMSCRGGVEVGGYDTRSGGHARRPSWVGDNAAITGAVELSVDVLSKMSRRAVWPSAGSW